jgi:hypothetical protein
MTETTLSVSIVPGFAVSLDILATVIEAGTDAGRTEARASLLKLGRFMDELAEAGTPATFHPGGKITPAPELISNRWPLLPLCEAAACLWEAALELERRDPVPDGGDRVHALRTVHGAASLRFAVCELAADCLADFEALSEDEREREDAFDWDYCPAWLARNLDKLAAKLEG